MVAAGRLFGLRSSSSWVEVLGLATGVIVVQALVSTWWLRRHRYGPLEWLWRWATWASRPTPARSALP